jgi:hypothetical protein
MLVSKQLEYSPACICGYVSCSVAFPTRRTKSLVVPIPASTSALVAWFLKVIEFSVCIFHTNPL